MNSLNQTFLPTKNYKNRNWFIIDCKDQKLGRLATVIATLLKGKLKPHYHTSVDIGDYIKLITSLLWSLKVRHRSDKGSSFDGRFSTHSRKIPTGCYRESFRRTTVCPQPDFWRDELARCIIAVKFAALRSTGPRSTTAS